MAHSLAFVSVAEYSELRLKPQETPRSNHEIFADPPPEKTLLMSPILRAFNTKLPAQIEENGSIYGDQ